MQVIKKFLTFAFDQAHQRESHSIRRIQQYFCPETLKNSPLIRIVYDTAEKYIIVLEPQRSPYGYYLLTAYYLNMPGGEKKIKKMLKKKLNEVL